MEKIDATLYLDSFAASATLPLQFCIQVNISHDSGKQGIDPEELFPFVEKYLHHRSENKLPHVKLIGLMTIGAQKDMSERTPYFAALKKLFDEVNEQYFKNTPLPILSMGMSDDYELAIKCGATMVRLGRCLFE